MEVTEFKSFFEGSSAKCFRALCDDGKDWVIRCKKKNKNSKRLFSEYVAGKLAIEFGINRPDCKVVKIPNTFMKKLNGFENIFDENCSYGVATLFINNLNSFKPPKTKSYLDKDFSKINFDFITKEMSGVKNFEQIYALKVFSHWIYLSDYHKYENLKITQDKKIVFLDFDLSFESNEGSWGRMPDYSYIKIKTNQAPFWEGLTNEIDPFLIWLKKLESLTKEECFNKLETIPDCWGIPELYTLEIFNSLFDKRLDFKTEFIHAIEFQKDLNSII